MKTPATAPQRYLDIATRQFAASGFHGVSLAALASEAGVSKQALLHFFGTKERLYAEVLSHLAERLCAQIDEVEASSSAKRLQRYFETQLVSSSSEFADVSLVVRALLDSRTEAKLWPLKRFLDKLIALAQDTPRWRNAPQADVLAGLYQLIGATQYAAISTPTLAGMYGDQAARDFSAQFAANIRDAVRAFVEGD